MKNKFKSKFVISVIVYVALIIILNVAGRWSRFCDFYTDHMFRWVAGGYTRLTGLFPFSVGEVLIPIAAFLVVGNIILLLVLIALRRRKGFKHFVVVYSKCILILILTVGLVMTLNCSIPYNCSKLEINGNGDKEYSKEDIRILRNYIVEKCNELSVQMQRDSNDNVVYGEHVYEDVKTALNDLSTEYPRLKGYYPNPKKMIGSFVMYQAGMAGVYFPFTMEANYNSYISATSEPCVVAHELCHLKGYMYEDEANFMACIACIQSDDLLVRYSGYLSALRYIDDDFMNITSMEEYNQEPEISMLAWYDSFSYTDEVYEELVQKDEDSVINKETVSEVNDEFTDAYMNYYDVTPNYSEMTLLLLQYFDGSLY